MKRRTVLFVVPLPPPWAGVEQISSMLVGSHLRDQFDIDVLKSNVRSSNATKGAWDLAGISRVLSITVRLAFRLLRRRPDIVYMTLSQNSSGLARDLAYAAVCRLFGVPVVAHHHGSKLAAYLNSRPVLLRRALVRALSSIETVLVCANSIKSELTPLFPSTRIETVYNACAAPVADVPKSPLTPFTVAFMGHLSAAKGFYDLISAAEKVLQVHPRARFEMAGERLDNERNVAMPAGGGDWDAFESLRARFPDNFHFHGIITGDAKARFLASADVFVLPSYAEAFPVAVLEAMAAGLPLIVTPVGALPEVLKDGVNGFFVAPGDASSIAEKILRLIESKTLRERIGAENRAAAQNFSVSQMVSAMARIFQQQKDRVRINVPARPVLGLLIAGFVSSLFLAGYSSVKAAMAISVLAAGALVCARLNSRMFLSIFLFALPLSGLAGTLTGLRGVPFLLPVFYAGAAGAWGNLLKDGARSLETEFFPPVFLFGANAALSAAVAVAGFYPWGGPTHVVAVAPWGPLLLANAMGWVLLAFLTTTAGLILYGWLAKSAEPDRLFFFLSAGFILPVVLGGLQYGRFTSFGVPAIFLQGGKPQYNATFLDPNALGMSCALIFSVFFGRFLARAAHWWEWIGGVLSFFLLSISASRSAYMTVSVSIFVLIAFALRDNRKRLFIPLLLLFLLGGAFIADQKKRLEDSSRLNVMAIQFTQVLKGQRNLTTLLNSRSLLWKSAWITFRHNPVLGVGAGAYLIRFLDYRNEIGAVVNDNAGSQYLQMAAEQGVVGLAVFLFLIGSLSKEFLLSREKTAAGTGAFAALAGLMPAFFFGAHIINFEVSMYFWLCLSLMKPLTENRPNEYSN